MATTIILGAGMVGVSSALALQALGDNVVLVDRKGIGRETSYGNAGAIQTEAVEPYAFPRDLARLARIALKRSDEVNWHLRAMPEHLRPLMQYWLNSGPDGHARASRHYHEIVAQADLHHEPLIAAAGAADLIERRGYHVIFRSANGLDLAWRDAERLSAQWGVASRRVDGAALAALEPGLKQPLPGAVHYFDVWTCRSPGDLTAAYGRLFQERGGSFVHGDANSLEQVGAGWRLRLSAGEVDAERVVVALGAWSAQLAAKFGYRIPLFRKRGYHRHFNLTGGPTRPLYDAERSTFLAPMNQGLRLCTGAEFTQLDARIDWRQIRRSEAAARELFDFGDPIEAEPWFGHRPCLPDMLPVIGEAPRHRGLWFNFGHGHQGFTAGPASAQILTNAMVGNPLAVTGALEVGRFS
ncbi:NAD(P)/FAD-dependent oxidoreductase [Paracoccus litorisediminis]|uniref:NAD(P)/FAD-dependent oxidoreductase n=1 Tax=Paracoccus litorisediminis TaxID=2006130 RepID=UPI0037304A76